MIFQLNILSFGILVNRRDAVLKAGRDKIPIPPILPRGSLLYAAYAGQMQAGCRMGMRRLVSRSLPASMSSCRMLR